MRIKNAEFLQFETNECNIVLTGNNVHHLLSLWPQRMVIF